MAIPATQIRRGMVIVFEGDPCRIVEFRHHTPGNLRAMFPAMAKAHGATLMPFLLDSVAGRPQLNQPDGVHPNLAGERIVTAHVWRTVGPLLDSLARAPGIAGGRQGS
jgi:hypothetical protein